MITPCLGHTDLYDAALFDRVPPAQRFQARQEAAALCRRCPITTTCADRITAPPRPTAVEKPMTVTDLTPPKPPRLDPADLTPATAEELIEWGSRHPTTRIQGLAAKARSALNDLRQAAEREAAVAAAEARVQRLKAQLANAERDLRAAKGTGAPAAKNPTAAPREDLAAIRAWARANGYQVAPKGLVAKAIRDAYYAANPAPLAATG